MGLSADLYDLCQDTATWNALSSRDSYGNPTFSLAHSNYPARRTKMNRLVRDKDAQEVVSTQQVIILPSLTSGDPFPNIQAHDQVLLSDGSTPQIASVKIWEDELMGQISQPAYTEVFFV